MNSEMAKIYFNLYSLDPTCTEAFGSHEMAINSLSLKLRSFPSKPR